MNILYITHCDPRLTDFGSAQRSHYLWQALQKIGNVYTVYNVSPKEKTVIDEENKICSASFAPDGYVWLHLFAWFNKLFAPFVWPFRKGSILRRKMPWKNVVFDRIVVRYLSNVALSNAWKFGNVYVDIDDLPTESYNTIHRKQLIPPFGWIGGILVEWWQRHILRKCKAAWIASSEQVSIVKPYCPCEVLFNLPLPPKDGYRINGNQKRQLMTVGLMSYEPNYEGVDWFLENVWPKLHERFSDLTYMICGRGTPERLRKKWSSLSGVNIMGFVEDIDKIYEESIAVVTPILSGAGTCIKVSEATLHGRKVFATPFAVRGVSNENIVSLMIEVSSTAKEMIEKILSWISIDSNCCNIAQHDIEAVSRKEYTQEKFFDTINIVLLKC